MQTLTNKQSDKVSCRFDRLTTAHRKRQTSHMSLENLSAAHTVDYIVLRLNLALQIVKTLLQPCTQIGFKKLNTIQRRFRWFLAGLAYHRGISHSEC